MIVPKLRLLGFVGLLVTVGTLQYREVSRLLDARVRPAGLGKQAPNLSLEDAQGQPLEIRNRPGDGRFLVVSFWASWCLPCRVEMPELVRFVEEWNEEHDGPEKLLYVAVNLGELPEQVPHVLKDPRYEHVVFGFDPTGKAAEVWGVDGLPATFLVSPQGRVLEAVAGYDEDLHIRLRGRLRSVL